MGNKATKALLLAAFLGVELVREYIVVRRLGFDMGSFMDWVKE